MIFATSLPRFKAFVRDFRCQASHLSCCLLFLVPFLLPLTRRSVAAAARSILSDGRDAGWLLRWLGCSKAPAAALAAAQVQLQQAAQEACHRLHVLVIDSTQHGVQGQHAENSFARGNTRQRARQSQRKQKKTHRKSCHTFVFALLLTPSGLRIPSWLPFYTKEYCALFNRQHLSQASLAAQLIDSIAVREGTPVVVVGDTAFEAKQVRQACDRRDWQWVVPLNPQRRLATDKPRPQVRSLYQQLSVSDFRRVSFRLDEGELAALARVSPKRCQSRKHTRTYWVHHRTAAIYNIGEVALLFSTQKEPTTSGGVTVQKVLISNAVQASTEQLLHWYSLRWQIELFFKEMKSDLGMCQYKFGPFQRVVGWVTLSVTAFCYLEWYRWQQQQEATGKDKPFWQRLRTHGLKEQLRQQVLRADLETVLREAQTPEGREKINVLLHRICADPVNAAA